MKTASLKEIRTELSTMHPSALVDICVRLVKYRKENKELISYLLFEADDEDTYIADIKKELDEQFEAIKDLRRNEAKRYIQKSLRLLNKYIRYSGNKQTETALRIYFCIKMRHLPSSFIRKNDIAAIMLKQVQAARKAIATLHEDLQYDYEEELKKARLNTQIGW